MQGNFRKNMFQLERKYDIALTGEYHKETNEITIKIYPKNIGEYEFWVDIEHKKFTIQHISSDLITLLENIYGY